MLELQLTGVLCARVSFHAAEIYVLAEVFFCRHCKHSTYEAQLDTTNYICPFHRITYLSFPHRLDNKAGRSPSQHPILPIEPPQSPRRRHQFRSISACARVFQPPQPQTYRHVFPGRSRVLDGCEPVESVCQSWTAG